ncbi:MAG TPA: lysozyme inhibitor LprI family protein [Pseudolabrys sp.]
MRAIRVEAQCEGGTHELVDCLGAQREYWDKKMTAAYRDLLKYTEGKQKEQLRAAQRLWIQYRDANCLFYRLGEGSIALVEAVECARNITQSRAKELIGINTPGADQPAPGQPGKEDRD